ncbi:unnamed protein product, partial [marine sediment metagenome]
MGAPYLSINYGTIDVSDSGAVQSYQIYNTRRSNTITEALNMSISFKENTNASEVREDSWVWVSTALTTGKVHIGSVGTGPECGIHTSIVSGRSAPGYAGADSQHVTTNIIVPAGAVTAGAV